MEIRFTKGGYYEDHKRRVYICMNARKRSYFGSDQHVEMAEVTTRDVVKPTGPVACADIARKMTTNEIQEFYDACERECEAIAETERQEKGTTTMTTKTTTKRTAKKSTAGKTTKKAATTKAKPAAKKAATKTAAKAATPAEAKPAKAKAEKRMSQLDAAAQILKGANEPMTTKALVEAMVAKNLWASPGGKTPDRTLYAAILREINTKGADSRFKKATPGHFTHA